MTATNDIWSARIEAAADTLSRQQLLAEVGAWRAAHLTDIPGLRGAAFAISRLYMLLGLRDHAVREARALLSLAQTPPEASNEELHAAVAWLQSLGVDARLPSARRPRKQERKQERGKKAHASQAAPEDPRAALAALKGKRGPKARIERVRLELILALQQEDGALRDEIKAIVDSLGPRPRKDEPQPEARQAREPSRAQRELEALLGKELPYKLQPYIRLLEDHLDEHPADADRLAALALRHHVSERGTRKPAPWLVGTVGRALATTPGTETRAALNELERKGAFAVAAYAEWPFERLVALVAAAEPQGWDLTALRRGVGRGEPRDRRTWTARLVRDFDERMLVVCPPSYHDLPPQAVGFLAERLPALCEKLVVLAPGAGNASVRDVLGSMGAACFDQAGDAELLEALHAATPVKGAPPRPVEPKPEAKPEPLPEPQEPPKPKPGTELLTALQEGGDPLPALQRFRRLHQAFGPVRGWLTELEPAALDAAVVRLLTAMDQVAPPEVFLPEGTTLLLRAATAQPQGQARDMLLGECRFTGPGAAEVLQMTSAAVQTGWSLLRVHRGPTGRERRANPALQAMGDASRSLWRVVLRKGEVEAELWFVPAEMAPEGRAAVPLLLLDEQPRVVVLPLVPELLDWYRELGGPEAVGWTGEEAAEITDALGALTSA